MKIGIAIDDTLTNTKKLQLIYWKQYYENNPNKNYKKILPKNINEFGLEYINTFWDTYREQLSFNSPFKKGTSKYLKLLKKDNHTLCIITSRPKEKYNNLEERLKDIFKENKIPIDIIYTNILDKGLFCKENNIDLLIDDDIKNINSANKYNIKSILFNKNNKYNGLQTTNWKEIYKIIKEQL